MTTRNIKIARSTGDGRQVFEDFAGCVLDVIQETITVAQFTDGGGTSGTYQMIQGLPAGALFLATRVGPVVGFAGDTTAALIIGDGSDTDRYLTGTPSVFTTAAVGVDVGVPSGTKLLTAFNRPTLTITSSADFTSVVTNAAGVLTVTLYYIQT